MEDLNLLEFVSGVQFSPHITYCSKDINCHIWDSLFYNCSSLHMSGALTVFNTKSVLTVEGTLFYGCTSVSGAGALLSTSNVVTFKDSCVMHCQSLESNHAFKLISTNGEGGCRFSGISVCSCPINELVSAGAFELWMKNATIVGVNSTDLIHLRSKSHLFKNPDFEAELSYITIANNFGSNLLSFRRWTACALAIIAKSVFINNTERSDSFLIYFDEIYLGIRDCYFAFNGFSKLVPRMKTVYYPRVTDSLFCCNDFSAPPGMEGCKESYQWTTIPHLIDSNFARCEFNMELSIPIPDEFVFKDTNLYDTVLKPQNVPLTTRKPRRREKILGQQLPTGIVRRGDLESVMLNLGYRTKTPRKPCKGEVELMETFEIVETSSSYRSPTRSVYQNPPFHNVITDRVLRPYLQD